MLSTAQAIGGTLRPAKARRKDTHPAADPETLVAPPDLMSMRPAAPGRLNLRILFTFGTEDAPEPAARGSVLLLAAAASHAGPLGEPDPLITQALGRYWLAVTGDQAPGTGPASYDRASFASEFFPGEAAALAEEAAALVARTRPYGLAALRNRSGLTQAQVAERLGVRQERVSALERGDLSAAEVRTLAAYVTALGGRLDITAEFGTDNLPLA
jgi:DNA-binding XRE family transcriptional regulator